MALRDFTPTTAEVPIPGSTEPLTVRGLSFDDLAQLTVKHYDTMQRLWDRFVGEVGAKALAEANGADDGLSDGMQEAMLEALKVAPELVAEVVARAADEPDAVHQASLLPVGTLVDAVQAVFRLTVEAEGGLEKLVGTVQKVSMGLADMATESSP